MNCAKCGRFTKRMRDAIGVPLSTGFPPDKPWLASSIPYAPFVCCNHGFIDMKLGRVEYQLVACDYGENGEMP